jgi:hypothetical protein
LGVTSIVRTLGLAARCYYRLLHFFHSTALDLGRLTNKVRSCERSDATI